MTPTTTPVFSHQVFAASARREPDKRTAVQGFAQIFASMLCSEMRHGILGADSGPMGIAGGATGDIYGSFLDQAMGKALAKSPAMKSLNDIVSRQLDGPGFRRTAGMAPWAAPLPAPGRSLPPQARSTPALATVSAPGDEIGPAGSIADDRGPLLLPPRPAMFAPPLPPPKILTEG
jgi:Rod binding domain-containing protein